MTLPRTPVSPPRFAFCQEAAKNASEVLTILPLSGRGMLCGLICVFCIRASFDLRLGNIRSKPEDHTPEDPSPKFTGLQNERLHAGYVGFWEVVAWRLSEDRVMRALRRL